MITRRRFPTDTNIAIHREFFPPIPTGSPYEIVVDLHDSPTSRLGKLRLEVTVDGIQWGKKFFVTGKGRDPLVIKGYSPAKDAKERELLFASATDDPVEPKVRFAPAAAAAAAEPAKPHRRESQGHIQLRFFYQVEDERSPMPHESSSRFEDRRGSSSHAPRGSSLWYEDRRGLSLSAPASRGSPSSSHLSKKRKSVDASMPCSRTHDHLILFWMLWPLLFSCDGLLSHN